MIQLTKFELIIYNTIFFVIVSLIFMYKMYIFKCCTIRDIKHIQKVKFKNYFLKNQGK